MGLVFRLFLYAQAAGAALIECCVFGSTPQACQHGASRQVVKGYEQGKLSKHIVGLEVGDTLEFKGPVSKLEYAPNMKKALGMVPPAPCACRRL